MRKPCPKTRELRTQGLAACFLAAALAVTLNQAHATATTTDKGAASAARPAAPSSSVVINLIRLLVQEGVLTQDKANTLIRQAEDEAAAAARGQIGVNKQPAAGAAGGTAVASTGAPPSMRVPYIPEIVRKQIRDEVKQEVL